MKKQSHYFLSAVLLFSLTGNAEFDDGRMSVNYRTTLPVQGQTTGKRSSVQVELETTILDNDFSRRYMCRQSILSKLDAARRSIKEDLSEREVFNERKAELERNIAQARAALEGAEPVSQKEIREHIQVLRRQLDVLVRNHSRNYQSLFDAIQSLERIAERDWNRFFDTVYSFNNKVPESSNILKAFLIRHQLTSQDFDYFLTHFSEGCSGNDGIRKSVLMDSFTLLPVEVKVRIPVGGMSSVQIQEIKADIFAGQLGGYFKARALGYWVRGSEFQDGWHQGFHVGGIEWAPEKTAPIGTDLIFKFRTSFDFSFMTRGSKGDQYLRAIDPLVRGQAIQILTKRNETGTPLTTWSSGSAKLGIPPSLTSDEADGFDGGSLSSAKIGVAARLWSALEFSLFYTLNYFDTSGGHEDFEGNFESIEQSAEATLSFDLTKHFSLDLYSRYDARTMQAEHWMQNYPLSLPSQDDRALQVGGVITVKW